MTRLSTPWITGIGIGAAVAVGVTALLVLRDDSKSPAGSSPDTTTEVDGASTPSGADDRPPTGITVTLQRLVPGVPAANVGHPTSLVVQASGVAPLATIELWDGAALVATADPEGDAVDDDPTWQGVLDWVPTAVGVSTLVARVGDRDGRSATSNALRLLTQDQQSPLPVRAYVTAEGETPASIIEQQGLGADLAQLLFADMALDEPIPAGTELAIPVVDHLDQVPPSEEPPPAPASASDAVLPEVATADDGCSATIRYDPGETSRHTLVRLLPDSDLFQPVVTADGGVFDDVPVGPGTQLFAVEAVVDGVRSTSPPVAVTGADGCGGQWSGTLRIVHGVLEGVPDDIERVYLYVGTGGAWQRVPAEDQSSIPRRFGQLLVTPAMVDVTGAETVEIEGWGWRGAELVPLGRSRFTPAPGFDVRDVVGGGGGARLSIVMPGTTAGTVRLSSEEWIADPGVQTFRWTSSVAGTTHGIWQVLAFDPPTGASPFIAGVLAEGEVTGNGGDFTIDLGQIIGDETEPTVALLPAYEAIAGPVAVDLVAALPAAPPPPGGAVLASGLAPLVADSQPQLLLPPVDDLYIRVVPMVGDHWPGVATGDVVVHTGPPDLSLSPGIIDAVGGVLDADPYELQATLTPPKPPNPGFANCWTFVTWRSDLAQPQKYGKQYAFWNQFLGDIGAATPLCPGVCYSWYDDFGVSGIQGGVKTTFGGGSCSSGSGGLVGAFETIWEGVTTLWDMFVGVFDTLKGVLVDIVVELSGCKAIAGQVADKSKAEAFCSTMATLAVNAALIYFGVPPTLPSSEQLKQAAKGELSALLVEAAKDLGIPCDEIGEAADVADKEEYTCESLAGELLDEVEKKLNEIFIQAAAASAGLSFPPGAVIRPAPQGQTTPPTVSVTVRPSATAPPGGGMKCPAVVSVGAEWWPALSPVKPTDAALAAKNGMSGAYVPAGFITSRLHGIPWLAKYSGPVTSLAVKDLPTEALTFQPGGAAPSATRTYMLSPVPRSPVGAKDFVFANDPRWVELPYHALQLHTGAKVQAEIYSPCTGLYRATTTLMFGVPVAFQKVP